MSRMMLAMSDIERDTVWKIKLTAKKTRSFTTVCRAKLVFQAIQTTLTSAKERRVTK